MHQYTTRELMELLGKTITIKDTRTGVWYDHVIADACTRWGQLRIQLAGPGVWFQPTSAELETIGTQP